MLWESVFFWYFGLLLLSSFVKRGAFAISSVLNGEGLGKLHKSKLTTALVKKTSVDYLEWWKRTSKSMQSIVRFKFTSILIFRWCFMETQIICIRLRIAAFVWKNSIMTLVLEWLSVSISSIISAWWTGSSLKCLSLAVLHAGLHYLFEFLTWRLSL